MNSPTEIFIRAFEEIVTEVNHRAGAPSSYSFEIEKATTRDGMREPSGHDRLDRQETAIRRDASRRRGSFDSGHWRQRRRVFPDGGPSGQQSGRPVSADIWRGKTVPADDLIGLVDIVF